MSYTVHYGWCRENTERFDDFSAALACYSAHWRETCGARLFGEGADWDYDDDGYVLCNDGLTEDERLAVEEAGP